MNTQIYNLGILPKGQTLKGQLFDLEPPRVFSFNKEKFQLIDFHPSWSEDIPEPHIRAWHIRKVMGFTELSARLMPVIILDRTILDILGIWNLLSSEWQTIIENKAQQIAASENEKKQALNNHMATMRGKRVSRYSDIPRQITCIQCGKIDDVIPAAVAKKMEQSCISIDTFVKEYKCRECAPRKKGRATNPAFAHLPKELICKCGHKVSTSPASIVQRATQKGMTPEEFIAQYQCQKCNPTKGQFGKKKSQKANEFPTETICIGCKLPVKIVKANIEEKAAILGITAMELVKNYKCRKCGGKITKEQKEAAKKRERKAKRNAKALKG